MKAKKRFVFLWSCVRKEWLAYIKNEADLSSAAAVNPEFLSQFQLVRPAIIRVIHIARRRRFKYDEAVSRVL